MGVKYVGGGYQTGIPRRDMTDAELASLAPDLVAVVRRSAFYTPIDDTAVQPERTDWTAVRETWPSVLMFTPTLRWEPETVDATHKIVMGYPGRLDYLLTRDNPDPVAVRRGYGNILLNLNKARKIALEGGYDAMFIVESDIIPPADALRRLALTDADVAGGLYPLRGHANTTNAFIHVPKQASPGAPLETVEIARAWGRQVRVNGVCLGCAFIWRHVLERFEFRLEERDVAAPDWYHMIDCNDAGLTIVLNLAVNCGHKQDDGVILFTRPDGNVGRCTAWNVDSGQPEAVA